MGNTLTFKNHVITATETNGKTWIAASDVATALGYARKDKAAQIYSRNRDEFSPEMSQNLKLRLSGNYETNALFFSLRGAHLVAMFARTPVAKEFRRWVLDILDRESRQGSTHAPTRRTQPISKREMEAQLAGGRLLVTFLPGGAAHYRLLEKGEVIIDKAERDYLRSQVRGLKSGLDMCATIAGHIDDLSTALKGA